MKLISLYLHKKQGQNSYKKNYNRKGLKQLPSPTYSIKNSPALISSPAFTPQPHFSVCKREQKFHWKFLFSTHWYQFEIIFSWNHISNQSGYHISIWLDMIQYFPNETCQYMKTLNNDSLRCEEIPIPNYESHV